MFSYLCDHNAGIFKDRLNAKHCYGIIDIRYGDRVWNLIGFDNRNCISTHVSKKLILKLISNHCDLSLYHYLKI